MAKISLLEEICKLNNMKHEQAVSDYLETALSSCVFSAIKDHNNFIEIDIGIGSLFINIEDTVLYKFVPSKSLEDKIADVCSNSNDPMVDFLDDKINKRLYKIYRELLS